MASLALHLRSHPTNTLLKSTTSSSNLTFSLLFSSSSSSDNNNNNNNNNNGGNPPEKSFPFSTYFSDIKSKLKQHEEQRQHQLKSHQPQQQQDPSSSSSSHSSQSPRFDSLSEIKKNLSEYRRRSSEQSPPPPPQQQTHPSSSPLRNVGGTTPEKKGGNLSFDAIRQSLQNLRQMNAKQQGGEGGKTTNMSDKMSLNNYKSTFAMRSDRSGNTLRNLIGGSPENLPMGVFGKELSEKEGKRVGESEGSSGEEDKEMKEMVEMELAKMYTHDELGSKLKELRPGKKGGEFSIAEMSGRLKKLKKIEEEESNSRIGSFPELRKSLQTLQDTNKQKKKDVQGFDIMATPSFMLSPPKEHLVEKYFHPDNMSAEEKLKLELKKVRDEFKMHESDCGSTRVQIAQLTTEILHLSSVLHKKDKHSRRGLLAKVQQRKKLLKYLRRTDWESYCFVLSKLGLRDNPDYKN